MGGDMKEVRASFLSEPPPSLDLASFMELKPLMIGLALG